jgi:hypothetical protein
MERYEKRDMQKKLCRKRYAKKSYARYAIKGMQKKA